jgi:hypothetical protein
MIVLYVIKLLLVIIFSIGALVLVAGFNFEEGWKFTIASVLSVIIMMAAIILASYGKAYKQDAEEFTKLIQEATFYLHNK